MRLSSSTSASESLSPPKLPGASVEASNIMHLMDSEIPSTPKEIAEFLHEMPHSDPKMVGQVLGEPDAKSMSVLHEYANGFQFEGVAFDIALRVYLSRFELPREAQKIDRILQAFPRPITLATQTATSVRLRMLCTRWRSPCCFSTQTPTTRSWRGNSRWPELTLSATTSTGGEAGSARPEVPDAYLGQCYDLFVADAIKRIERKPVECYQTKWSSNSPTRRWDWRLRLRSMVALQSSKVRQQPPHSQQQATKADERFNCINNT
ncbi:Bem1/Scd2 [Phytophthora cactorum]|nr:Bem1/Scd2 [Phytophthora cactorum]